MNKREFPIELAEIQRLCARMTPEQVKKVRKRLKKDLKKRPEPKPTGIKVGDRFTRHDPDDRLEKPTPWILRRRHTSPLLDLAEGAVRVALMPPHIEVRRKWADMKPMNTWSGWHAVENHENITDQEWEHLCDGGMFLDPSEPAPPKINRIPPAMAI